MRFSETFIFGSRKCCLHRTGYRRPVPRSAMKFPVHKEVYPEIRLFNKMVNLLRLYIILLLGLTVSFYKEGTNSLRCGEVQNLLNFGARF